MATNLSPELLAQLQAYFALPQGTQQDINENPGMYRGAYYFDPATGMTYHQGGGGYSEGPTYSGYLYTPGTYNDNRALNGSPYDVYDASGNLLRTNTFQDIGGHGFLDSNLAQDLIPTIAIGGAMGLTAAGVGAAAGAGAGAAGAGGSSLAAGSGLTGTTGASLTGGMGTFAPAGMGYAGSGALGVGGAAYGGAGALGLDAALSNFGAQAASGLAPGMEVPTDWFPEESPWTPTPNSTPLDFPQLPPGVPPPTNPFSPQGRVQSMLNDPSSLLPSSVPNWLGPAATLAGGLLGSQGQDSSQSSTRQLPPYLQNAVAGQLIPQTQQYLNSQLPMAWTSGQEMINKGTGLMNAPVAGNGFTSGAVKMETPTTAQNPYLSGLASDMQRRTQDMLGNSFNQIRGNAVGYGGLGSSRQGIAESEAIKGAADSLQGNLAGLYGNAWNADANRALSKYNTDVGFFNTQRGMDLSQLGIGSGLVSQGYQTQMAPLTSAANIYSPFSGFGTTTTNGRDGGGAMGALGGALGAAQLGKNMSWW